MQTQSLYMSFLTRHNVQSCLCMAFPFTSSLLHYWWSVCVQHRCFSLSSACFIFQVASKSICSHMSLFLPSPNTFLCYINNLHLPPQICGTWDFHRCRFLFQSVCLWWTRSSENVSYPSLFQMTQNADFSLSFNSVSSVTPACFCSLSSKSLFVLALQMGSTMSPSCSLFYSPHNYLVCRNRKR